MPLRCPYWWLCSSPWLFLNISSADTWRDWSRLSHNRPTICTCGTSYRSPSFILWQTALKNAGANLFREVSNCIHCSHVTGHLTLHNTAVTLYQCCKLHAMKQHTHLHTCKKQILYCKEPISGLLACVTILVHGSEAEVCVYLKDKGPGTLPLGHAPCHSI